MKFKTKTKDCYLVVKVKKSRGEMLNEDLTRRFAMMQLRGFLRPSRITKSQIEYTGPIGTSLYDRLKTPITKNEFLKIMEQIVILTQKLKERKFSDEYLVTDIQNVYFNNVTKEIQLLYAPSSFPVNRHGVSGLMEQIVYSVIPADEPDREYVARFINAVRLMKKFDLMKIEQFISNEDLGIVANLRKQNAGESGYMTDKQRDYLDHYNPSGEDSSEKTGLLDDGEATGLLDESQEEATGLLSMPDEEATGLLSGDPYGTDYYTGSDATHMLGDDDATGLLVDPGDETGLLVESRVSVRYPTLLRCSTNETILINKPVFRLGKEQSYVDYFVANNVMVSRSHADVITRSGRYFVKDLNSTNHTYINEREVPPQCEMELQDGDLLRLGNEEFVFHI